MGTVTNEYDDEKPKVASYWKTIALTASILMFVFLVLGIIASVVAVNQRKAINAQLDWDNTEARMEKAGVLKEAEIDQEDKTGDAIRTGKRTIAMHKEWIRSFDEDSTTRDAKVTYCNLKRDIKELEEKDTKADWVGDDDWKKTQSNRIAIKKAKIESLDKEM